MSELFGWDLVYKLSESNLNKKEDVITLLIHFLLIKNGFKCCGSGEDAGGKGSEVLPSGWSSSDNYSLNYVCEDQSYVLRGLQVNNSLVFNLLDTQSLAVSNIAVVAEKEVKAVRGDIKTVLTDAEGLMRRIDSSLIRPVKERISNNREATTQTSTTDQRPQPSYNDPFVSPLRNESRSSVGMVTDPLRIGGADLDPLGGLAGPDAGGMLFDPFHQPRRPDTSELPRGSVPPGARFDPFAPPGVGGLPPRRPRGPPDFNSMDPFGGGFGRGGGFGGGFI